MPLQSDGSDSGWVSKHAFVAKALAADSIGRQAIEDEYFSADAAMRAKFADSFVNAAKIAAEAVTTEKIAANAVTEAKIGSYATDGLHVKRLARATYDFAEHGGAIGQIGLGVTLPDNAVVTRAWYEVLTTLTSGGADTATVSIDIPTDDEAGLVAAIAINNVANPWDQGNHECIQDGTAAKFSEKCTAARELAITVAGQAVTSGKFILFAEYVISD